jgi:two-component system alkaline phosphatase synthesis response regulator PhoP
MRQAASKPTVLIVEDEATLAEVLADNLVDEGYLVEVARDGRSGRDVWSDIGPDLVVLDVMLPGLNGYELCEAMRRAGDSTPVLFLSARGQADDRVRGLQAGGDDYLPKPFHLPEFLLRVANMLRRRGWGAPADSELSFGGHRVDFRGWTAELKGGRRELLGERELGILRLLASRPGEVVSRDDILDEVWGDDAFPSSRTVDNFVMRLRKLFEPDPADPVYFHTVWGVGYRFSPEGEETTGKKMKSEEEANQ